MDEKKAAFLPFHAVNEFMLSAYRAEVIRTALLAAPHLPAPLGRRLNTLTRKHVRVAGFRDARKAPPRLRVQPSVKVFEKNAEFAAAVLAAWAESRSALRRQVYDLLTARGWETLPPEADRTRLPGFLAEWPEDEHFETLTAAFRTQYPDSQASDDDIALMCVWISGRLPYRKVRAAAHTEAEEASSGA